MNILKSTLKGISPLHAVAEVVGLSPQRFAVLFRESTGFTPHRYVDHRRVERAQRLLANLELSLVDQD